MTEGRTHFRVSEIAAARDVKTDTVLAWIASGQLTAVNVAMQANGRPRWRIAATALEAFDRSRSSQPTPKARPRRRRRQGAAIEFF